MNPILFLDIDGVLNTKATFGVDAGLDAERVLMLRDVLKETGADIILSSAWRYMGWGVQSPIQQCLRGILPRSDYLVFRKALVGATPQEIEGENRDQNIQRWLDTNSHGDVWVALDDLPIVSNLGEGRYLVVGDKGLLPKDCKKLRGMLCPE